METGIWVRVPESMLDRRVSVQFENFAVPEGLKRILRGMNHGFCFDRQTNLLGAFVFEKPDAKAQPAHPDELKERIVQAAEQGGTAAVAALLAEGADVNAKGRYSGWTPLITAVRKDDIGLVNLLLARGADADVKSSVRSRTALMEAARNRTPRAVEALLAAGPDVNAADWEGHTALMFAAVSGQLDIVHALIAHGADVNATNNAGSSALMMAAGYPEVIEILKQAGASEQAAGFTPALPP